MKDNYVFVVVTEDYYGGGENLVKVFESLDKAKEYSSEFTDKDTVIIKTEIQK